MAEVVARHTAELAAEREAVAELQNQLEAAQKQISHMKTAAEASRAQFQAEQISAQQKLAGYEKTKAEIEVPGPVHVHFLMGFHLLVSLPGRLGAPGGEVLDRGEG